MILFHEDTCTNKSTVGNYYYVTIFYLNINDIFKFNIFNNHFEPRL